MSAPETHEPTGPSHVDSDRLDWLEAEARSEPLVLHAEENPRLHGFRGLGLNPYGEGRSLRDAIDSARGAT